MIDKNEYDKNVLKRVKEKMDEILRQYANALSERNIQVTESGSIEELTVLSSLLLVKISELSVLCSLIIKDDISETN